MGTTALHTLYAVQTGSATIDEIVDEQMLSNSARVQIGTSGDIEPTFVALQQQAFRLPFTSLALARALTALGINGAPISSPATFFHVKILQDSTREATLKHFKRTVNAGLFAPVEANGRQGGLASIQCVCVPRYNGTNDPVVFLDNQTLTGSPANDEFFTIGPVKINGTELDGVVSVRVVFGLAFVVAFSSGDIWPTFVAILERRNPQIVVETADAVAYNTYGISGVAQGATDSVAYFRKKAADGVGNLSDVTAQHIAFTVDAGHIGAEEVGGSHGDTVGSRVIISPVDDGSNPLFSISTASAIT